MIPWAEIVLLQSLKIMLAHHILGFGMRTLGYEKDFPHSNSLLRSIFSRLCASRSSLSVLSAKETIFPSLIWR